MKRERRFWKTLVAFVATLIASVFGYNQSKALAASTPDSEQPTVEERLDQVREQVEQRSQNSEQHPEWDEYQQSWGNWGNY